jgi:hypothetical protein
MPRKTLNRLTGKAALKSGTLIKSALTVPQPAVFSFLRKSVSGKMSQRQSGERRGLGFEGVCC